MSTEIQELLAQLVAINSVNSSLVAGAPGEEEISRFVASWCERKGFETSIVDAKGRPSVVAIARGRGGGKSMMFNGHLDTVGVEGMDHPFTPRTDTGRMYGRGVIDMKAGVAAMLVAAAKLKDANLSGDVIVAAVADEEDKSVGTSAVLSRGIVADAAIVTEPTDLELAIAHKGFAWMQVTVEGRAAHGSRHAEGVDAIAKAGRFLTELDLLGQKLLAGSAHPLLGTGSLHASLITGGQEMSSYPAQCKIGLERRTVPGETNAMVLSEIRDILAKIANNDPKFIANAVLEFTRTPFMIDAQHPLISLVTNCIKAKRTHSPKIYGKTAWMDAALLSEKGIPTAVFGPTGGGLHGKDEWVDLASIEVCCDVLVESARTWCL
jgi:acetylornithine deacetylase